MKEGNRINGRMQQELEEQLRFQELISRTSKRFIDIPVDKIDQAINEQLREVGEFFEADRAVIARLSAKGVVLQSTHIWYSEQFDVESLKAHDIEITYPNFVNHFIHEDTFSFTNPDEYSHWSEVKEDM